MVGMKAMSAENVKKVFQVLDVDGSGFIEEEELKYGSQTDTTNTKRSIGLPNIMSMSCTLPCVPNTLYFSQVCTEGLFQGRQRSN